MIPLGKKELGAQKIQVKKDLIFVFVGWGGGGEDIPCARNNRLRIAKNNSKIISF